MTAYREREISPLEGTRRVLEEHERMLLVGADRDAFLVAVMEPPEPTEKLLKALKRRREMLSILGEAAP